MGLLNAGLKCYLLNLPRRGDKLDDAQNHVLCRHEMALDLVPVVFPPPDRGGGGVQGAGAPPSKSGGIAPQQYRRPAGLRSWSAPNVTPAATSWTVGSRPTVGGSPRKLGTRLPHTVRNRKRRCIFGNLCTRARTTSHATITVTRLHRILGPPGPGLSRRTLSLGERGTHLVL